MRTHGEIYGDRISTAKTPEDVELAWQQILDESKRDGVSEEIARHNLGYMLGYYGDEEQRLWYATLDFISHPIFGHGFGRGNNPNPQEAFAAGMKMGNELKRERSHNTEGTCQSKNK